MSDEKPADDWDDFRVMMNGAIDTAHYDRDGNLIGAGDAMTFNADPDYCRVALSHVTDGPGVKLEVSTIWLGIDFGTPYLRHEDAKPVIFETMTWDERGDIVHELCGRYSTQDEARAGHARIVERAAEAMAAPITWHVHPAP